MHRRAKKDLRKLDKDTSTYWEEVLRREGLSMDAGTTRRIVHVGSTQTLEMVADMVMSGIRPDDKDGDITYERVPQG